MDTNMTASATETTGFDLGQIAQAAIDKAWATITHPVTGAPTDMRIQVASPDSDLYKRIDRKIKNRSLTVMQKTRGRPVSIEAMDASGLELLVGITVGWEGARQDGRDLECNEENTRMLYTKFPFIREQVDTFVGDRANFFSS